MKDDTKCQKSYKSTRTYYLVGQSLYIFGNPSLDGKGWHGFTRDYNQCEGAFDNYGEAVITDLQEYIDDLKIYKKRNFDYKETKEVYELICSWLTEAQENNCSEITVKVF